MVGATCSAGRVAVGGVRLLSANRHKCGVYVPVHATMYMCLCTLQCICASARYNVYVLVHAIMYMCLCML
jgi:hypothetical protein